jgi:DNA invertase Pin-like site-specific DNA recombinase
VPLRLATFERHLIQQRTSEGRKRARARGVRFGRPPKLNAYQQQEALARLNAGETQADGSSYDIPITSRQHCVVKWR